MTDGEFPPDKIRSPKEIARRALALHAVWELAVDAPRDEVLRWLDEHELRACLSPNERKFAQTKRPSQKMKIDFSWHAERLIVLLWALKLVDRIPKASVTCDTRVFKKVLPPDSKKSTVKQFISRAGVRSEKELLEQAESALQLHWEARDAYLNNRKPKNGVDAEVVQERHHAINWITGYCGLDWDDVTTDT